MPFSANQQKFIGTYSKLTGLHPGVVSAQVAAEEPVGAQAGWHGTQNWLNIGITDSGPMGVSNAAWRDPVQAAKLSAAWATGQSSLPGFGHAAPSIVNAVRGTAGQSPQAQISALQRSGWASSGYGNLGRLYSMYGANNPSAGSIASMPSGGLPQAPAGVTLEVPKQVTSFDAAGFEKARRGFMVGSFLQNQKGLLAPVGSGASNPLFASGLATTTAPNKADYMQAHTVLQKVAGDTPLTPHPGTGIPGARPGKVAFAPQARIGVQPITIDTLSQASAGIGHPLYVGTGKVGHSLMTVNGNVSEHSTGHAADLIASDSGLSNEALGQSLYRYFTGSKAAPAGGLFNIDWHGHRIQLIYQTMEGGNHYTHVHVGVK